MSKAHIPPVPPANRPAHGGAQAQEEHDRKSPAAKRDINTDQAGQTGNIRVNTQNQGHQQDR